MADGASASVGLERLMFDTSLSAEVLTKVRSSLLAYCAMDTLALAETGGAAVLACRQGIASYPCMEMDNRGSFLRHVYSHLSACNEFREQQGYARVDEDRYIYEFCRTVVEMYEDEYPEARGRSDHLRCGIAVKVER